MLCCHAVWIFQLCHSSAPSDSSRGRWCWTRLQRHMVGRSPAYPTFRECWRDARRHGLDRADRYEVIEP